MDSKISVALMEKARRIFEKEDTFLSFPLNPIAFMKEQLTSISEGALTKEAVLSQSTFSYLVNLMPEGIIWLPTEERYLWDTYDHVLQTAEVAFSTRTPAEEEEYQRVFDFLHDVQENGLWEDTQVVKTYNQYKDAWILALQDYKEKKIKAEFSSDGNVVKHWEEEEEPVLRKNIEDIERKWVSEGFRTQVEEARRKEEALEGRSPQQTWAEWRSLFDKDIDMLTDPNGHLFAPSGFSPLNAFDSNSWQLFTLNEDEANKLIEQAPEELRERLAPGQVDLDIEYLSFEYNSIKVIRSWLVTDVFRSRFWKFSDRGEVLSDGRIPPSGMFPAYVTALVFVRNVEIKLKPESSKNNNAFKVLKAKGTLDFGFFKAASQPSEMPSKKGITLFTSKVVPIKEFIIAHKAGSDKPEGAIASKTPVMKKLTIAPMKKIFIAHKITPTKPEASTARIAIMKGRTISALKSETFFRADIAKKVETVESRESRTAGTPKSPESSDNEYLIMAFICKRFPEIPNPDPTLQW